MPHSTPPSSPPISPSTSTSAPDSISTQNVKIKSFTVPFQPIPDLLNPHHSYHHLINPNQDKINDKFKIKIKNHDQTQSESQSDTQTQSQSQDHHLHLFNLHALSPLRAHYLKRELVTLQFQYELEQLSSPNALSLLGPPFLPPHHFAQNHLPLSPVQLANLSPPPPSSQLDLPFLRFFFNRFVLSFPFLINAPSTFFSHKLQPFACSFFARNISGSEDRDEETKRRKIAGKVEKHLALVMAAAIKLSDNNGQEQVVRVSGTWDLSPNDDDAFLATPELPPVETIPPNLAPLHSPAPIFDLNVVAIRRVRLRTRIRSKVHEEFLIRTRTPTQPDIYVSRRYGDFVKLAELLRVEFPDTDIRPPPPKDRRAVDSAPDDPLPLSNSSLNSTTSSADHANNQHTAPIHFSRERNRLTLRAYLHRLLTKADVSNSVHLYKFLTENPIELSPAEKLDVENREAMDRARESEKQKFRAEVEGRVRELDRYLRSFREELVKSDGLSRVFGTIREVDRVDRLPIEYRKVLEWARISLASTIYQVFLGSDSSSASFAQLKRMHGLMPYWAMRGVLKISNPVAMIRGVLDLFLARPFGATSLVQRMFSSGLYEEIRELKEDAEKVGGKIGDDRMCERVRMYVDAPREIQEIYESDAKNEGLDIMTIILRSSEGPRFDSHTYQRIHRAAQAFEVYKVYREGLADPELNEGPDNEDAWLFEDLHVYLRLLRRCRDKEQLIELIFEGTTSEMLKDIVTIFYSPLMQVYKAANISDSLADLQKFIDDLIRTVERAEEVAVRDPQKIVQTFVDLVGRHEGAFYNFVHQVHSKGAGLFDGLMHWIELFVNFVRQGLVERVSLETLLPCEGTVERGLLMQEIDEIVEYHRKLKVAHHERMTRRMARDGSEDGYDRERDAALVAGVMENLNLSSVVGDEVEEAAEEDIMDSDDDELAGRQSLSSAGGGAGRAERGADGGKTRNRHHKEIEPPELKIVPTLTPLFTELVKGLLR